MKRGSGSLEVCLSHIRKNMTFSTYDSYLKKEKNAVANDL